MIEVYERHVQLAVDGGASSQASLPARLQLRELLLTHEQRSRGRLRLPQPDGEEVRLFLERGEALQLGELLRGTRGELLRIAGAEEDVATARCDDWLTFSKACYHLGNRHVKLQVGERWLRIAPDHVLEDMLRLLGLNVQHERAVFDPEAGAYAGAHAHHHDEGQRHTHAHGDESHEHDHTHHHHRLLLRHGHHNH